MDSQKQKKDFQTEKRILNSARKIFHHKGLAGTRMQEIADDAGINKAMLHYYFRNKQKLFEAIFIEGITRIFPRIQELLNLELPLFEKLRYFVRTYISIIQDNIYLPGFVINEVNQNPELFFELINKNKPFTIEKFVSEIRKAQEDGLIIEIDPRMLAVNLVSLCIFPIIAKPVLLVIQNINEKEYEEFMEKRKTEVAEFIIRAIKKQ